jgi:3',5'-nucleoside bisphosphate phosphatase
MKPSLLCELHAHTTWSDGSLTLRELIDLYGHAGFDVLCVTDHVLREDDPWWPPEACVHEANFGSYLAAVEAEADRARALYDLLVVPGLELTYNHLDPDLAAHAVAVGLREFVSLDAGFVDSLLAGRRAGAALLAAHPHGADGDSVPLRSTRRFSREWEALAPLVHRAELFNGRDVYSWIAGAGVPAVASGDVHARDHLSSWKTLLPCAKDEEELVAFLRSAQPGYLVPFRAEPSAEPAAAA